MSPSARIQPSCLALWMTQLKWNAGILAFSQQRVARLVRVCRPGQLGNFHSFEFRSIIWNVFHHYVPHFKSQKYIMKWASGSHLDSRIPHLPSTFSLFFHGTYFLLTQHFSLVLFVKYSSFKMLHSSGWFRKDCNAVVKRSSAFGSHSIDWNPSPTTFIRSWKKGKGV